MFKDFHKRLQNNIKKIVDERVAETNARHRVEVKVSTTMLDWAHAITSWIALYMFMFECQPVVINSLYVIDSVCFVCLLFLCQPVEVNVVTHPIQSYAVWFGGSVAASSHEFFEVPGTWHFISHAEVNISAYISAILTVICRWKAKLQLQVFQSTPLQTLPLCDWAMNSVIFLSTWVDRYTWN